LLCAQAIALSGASVLLIGKHASLTWWWKRQVRLQVLLAPSSYCDLAAPWF
jgi:hypothetical protein